MAPPNIAELHGLTVAEVLDVIYRRAIDRAAPKLAACWARYERREERRLAEQTRTAFTTLEAETTTASLESSARNYKAKARHLLDAGQCVSLTFGIGSPVRAQLNVPVPLRQCQTLVQDALGRELLKAVEPIISGLRKGTIEAEGALSLQPPKQIPQHLFHDTCTFYRQGARLVVHDHRAKPTLTYSAVRLGVATREQLPMGKAVRKAMDDKRVPLGSTSRKMLKPVREWLSENGYPTPDTPGQDDALMAHIRREQRARNEEAKR